ncbi:MAG: transposase [Deltaproteobacteria bacterium]|nr:transposase [Deltaproteobacteria bacterium]
MWTTGPDGAARPTERSSWISKRRVPVDLLDDRTSETLSTWLQAHPGVEIISRDRAGAYALGARDGAPDALQVADRWHLLKNVGEVLERVLHQHRRAIDYAVSPDDGESAEVTATDLAMGVAPVEGDAADRTTVPLASPTPPVLSSIDTSSAEVAAEGPRTAREVAFEQVHALRATGLSIREVTKRLGLSRITVRKYLRAEQFPRAGGTSECKPFVGAVGRASPNAVGRGLHQRAGALGRADGARIPRLQAGRAGVRE